jgi:20S proteasome alpha/beta subunit
MLVDESGICRVTNVNPAFTKVFELTDYAAVGFSGFNVNVEDIANHASDLRQQFSESRPTLKDIADETATYLKGKIAALPKTAYFEVLIAGYDAFGLAAPKFYVIDKQLKANENTDIITSFGIDKGYLKVHQRSICRASN